MSSVQQVRHMAAQVKRKATEVLTISLHSQRSAIESTLLLTDTVHGMTLRCIHAIATDALSQNSNPAPASACLSPRLLGCLRGHVRRYLCVGYISPPDAISAARGVIADLINCM
jgi:hypothetical protein